MSRLKTAALVFAISFGGIANAASPAVWRFGEFNKAPTPDFSGLAVLYDQSANDIGGGVNSQNYEAIFDSLDDQAADDFTVPSGSTWTLVEVDVFGQYGGPPGTSDGPAASERITIYADQKGKPGKVIADFPALQGSDNAGTFAITLPAKGVKLKAGTYWISAQANMDAETAGLWYWENQTSVEGTPAVWRNPGNGLGTGCRKYTTETTCIPHGQGDHMFVLKGTSK